jgi:hypothetical protein
MVGLVKGVGPRTVSARPAGWIAVPGTRRRSQRLVSGASGRGRIAGSALKSLIWTSGWSISCSERPEVPSGRSRPRTGPARLPRRSRWARGCWRWWERSRPPGR